MRVEERKELTRNLAMATRHLTAASNLAALKANTELFYAVKNALAAVQEIHSTMAEKRWSFKEG
jgi:hypothetical protein